MLEQDFVATMTLLRKPEFHDLLMNYQRPERTFFKAVEYADTVTSSGRVKDSRPEDYLAAFARFVRETPRTSRVFVSSSADASRAGQRAAFRARYASN